MAFVDIFNYKKYFSNKGDSNVARIGHVNKLAARVTSPAAVTQLTSNITPVTIDSYSGVITTAAVITAAGSVIPVNNSLVTTNSTILVTLETATADQSKDLVVSVNTIADGSFKISVSVITGGTTTANVVKIHFLVIS
jgi:hypothetical protein